MKKLNTIKIIQGIFIIKSILWFLFGIIHLVKQQMLASVVLSLMLFIDAIIFLFLVFYINKNNKWIYYFALCFIGINIILTITDDFGVADLIVLILDGFLFSILIIKKKKFLKNENKK